MYACNVVHSSPVIKCSLCSSKYSASLFQKSCFGSSSSSELVILLVVAVVVILLLFPNIYPTRVRFLESARLQESSVI